MYNTSPHSGHADLTPMLHCSVAELSVAHDFNEKHL